MRYQQKEEGFEETEDALEEMKFNCAYTGIGTFEQVELEDDDC